MNEKIKIELELTKKQYSQLLRSLENDWMDNEPRTCLMINRIIKKIKEGRK